jgi:ribosome-associated toxin RatA of RatAB toxin-antitoxin module
LGEQATQKIVINAPPEACYEVAVDVERYPEWTGDVKEVVVEERDAEGRPSVVRFRAAAFGRSTGYTLRYDYSGAPQRVAWVEVAGDITKRLDGAYEFAGAGDGATEVTYHLEADLRIPLPSFVKRRAAVMITHAALHDLKVRVEGARAT